MTPEEAKCCNNCVFAETDDYWGTYCNAPTWKDCPIDNEQEANNGKA